MRICACLWGGVYNPIIPVFRNRPQDSRPDVPDSLTGAQVARGYVEFRDAGAEVEDGASHGAVQVVHRRAGAQVPRGPSRRWLAGWPRAVAHPRLPQIRACPTQASYVVDNIVNRRLSAVREHGR